MSKWFVMTMIALLIVVTVLDRELGAMMLLFSLFVVANERGKGKI